MPTKCETALADYDKANREVKEQYEELILWAKIAGVSVVALLGALASAIALLGTAAIEASTFVGIPLAVIQAILAILVALVGFLAAISLLASFIAILWNYYQWLSAKSARTTAMDAIRQHCPKDQWPPVP
jgi:phage-related minor tail protein